MTQLELLAPAKNLQQGKQAIDAGADALYIGGARFGARSQASNSISDIAELVRYAHLFGVKVFVAFNTILYDTELREAEQCINQLYEAGIDALIVQDMAILEMQLPPIALHASTQTNNATLEKVQFLQSVGFTRVVLARELSISEINTIASQTNIEIEAFIHGALCVSYSGQCYLSQYLSKRSGNRGECVQACRSSYTLSDNSGQVLAQNKHLMSLKDFNASDALEEMAHSGVKSFKIEGRLKDAAYVVNTVAWYRKELDRIIDAHPQKYKRASSGTIKHAFIPDLQRTFNRGYTNYFLNGRQKDIASPNTQKAIGQYIGKVIQIDKLRITIETSHIISNGDGLCFFDDRDQLQGFRVNKAEGTNLYPAQMPLLQIGCKLYRNNDTAFEQLVESAAAKRSITIDMQLEESENGVSLKLIDEDGLSIKTDKQIVKEFPKNFETNASSQQKQLSKTGDTCFVVNKCEISCALFMPMSIINELRREAIAKLCETRLKHFATQTNNFVPNNTPYPDKNLDYTANVSNHLARQFYNRHGVINIQAAFELETTKSPLLMTTRHCLRYDQKLCPIHHGTEASKTVQYPLWLHDSKKKYRLEFDCKACVMKMYGE